MAILMYKFGKYPTVLDLNTKFYIYEVKMLRKYTLNLRFKKNPWNIMSLAIKKYIKIYDV